MDSSAQELARAITEEAHALGLSKVGFAPALPPARGNKFADWLSDGKGGTMTYLNRSAEKRLNPQLVLAGARTIITVSQSYFQGWLPEEIRRDKSRGIIASYAWGVDYHEVLLEKLEKLAKFVESLCPQTQTKAYVDTGPILERDHAERGGIGFIGKNTLLIHPKSGSTNFIGEILTTVEIEPTNRAITTTCGSCTRCLTVCPTHAFPSEYILDSTLCISYLSIEFKGIIPYHLRPLMGNHIFGCDECQEVCPWNLRFSSLTGEQSYLQPDLSRKAPLLSELAKLSEAEFRERFAHSPVLRPKHQGILRNTCVSLGNWKNINALDSLEVLIRHVNPLIRLHAVWAIKQIEDKQAIAILNSHLKHEQNPEVLLEAQL